MLINIRRAVKTIGSGYAKVHFGQWAEDVFIRKLFPRNKKSGIYLDIGACHPTKFSNTACFWLRGWNGFNIDANPHSIKLFNKVRPSDKNIWAAVIPQIDYLNGIREVDLMLPNQENISPMGTCHITVVSERNYNEHQKVPAKSLPQIMTDYNIGYLDYLNIDIEGYDEKIINDWDFSSNKPKVISIEDHCDNKKILSSNISTLLFSNGYDLVARIRPTSIFYLEKS